MNYTVNKRLNDRNAELEEKLKYNEPSSSNDGLFGPKSQGPKQASAWATNLGNFVEESR